MSSPLPATPVAVRDRVRAVEVGKIPGWYRPWAHLLGTTGTGAVVLGLGVANVLAAHDAGARIFDSSFAGLGGCPFAPGATGNVATEDVAWTFEKMGISTGVDLDRLLDVAEEGVTIPGALSGGRVRNALHSRRCR